jgi:hypothetical protein
VRHFRTVGARLSLALLLVVAAVLAFVYLIVTPSLQDRLVDSRKEQVAKVASRVADELARPKWTVQRPTDSLAESFASASNTRVTIFEVSNRAPLTLSGIADAGGGGDVAGIDDDAVALKAARLLSPAQGVTTRGDRKYAEAAQGSTNRDYVVLVSTSILQPVVLEPLAVLMGGGLDEIDTGMDGVAFLWDVVKEEYLQRCDRAGLMRREVCKFGELPWKAAC